QRFSRRVGRRPLHELHQGGAQERLLLATDQVDERSVHAQEASVLVEERESDRRPVEQRAQATRVVLTIGGRLHEPARGATRMPGFRALHAAPSLAVRDGCSPSRSGRAGARSGWHPCRWTGAFGRALPWRGGGVRSPARPHPAWPLQASSLRVDGSHSVNAAPAPGSLDAVSRPPSASAIIRLIARPTPAPFRPAGSRRVNSRKIRCRFSGGIPAPVSRTSIVIQSPGSFPATPRRPATVTSIRPRSVYFTAFERRFEST